MDKKTFLLMGGYGGAGRSIANLLLAKTDLDLIIGGRHKDLADSLSKDLNQSFGQRTKVAYVDASDPATLSLAFKNVDMVIAASTTTQYTDIVARSAIAAGIDYLDIHHPQKNASALLNLAPEIKKAGLCFITQAGFHPGLPSVLTRSASKFFTRYRKSVVGVAMNTQFDKGSALDEFIDSLGEYGSEVFKGGRWKRGGLLDTIKIDFGSHIGLKTCYPMTMEEMRDLPKALGLAEAGVYVAGLNWFVDYLVTPAAMILGRMRHGLGRGLLAALMVWGLETFSDIEDEVLIVLEAEGFDESGPLKVRAVVEYNDAYYITAAPVAAYILQYLDGEANRPGLWMMGHIVEPERFLSDLKQMGIRVEVITSR